MFRLLLLGVLAAAAYVMIDAHWAAETRTLTLRVRTARELLGVAQGTARELGDRAMKKVVEEATPAVASGPPARRPDAEPDAETLPAAERARLDRLVQEKTRER